MLGPRFLVKSIEYFINIKYILLINLKTLKDLFNFSFIFLYGVLNFKNNSLNISPDSAECLWPEKNQFQLLVCLSKIILCFKVLYLFLALVISFSKKPLFKINAIVWPTQKIRVHNLSSRPNNSERTIAWSHGEFSSK